jgi:hypothetical protein
MHIVIFNNAQRVAGAGLVFKAGRFCLEFELARVVTNDANVAFRESCGRFRLDLDRQLHLSSLGPLQFHHHGAQDGVEGLHRPV